MAWKLLESKIVFDNFMQVEERSYEMPDGHVKRFYIKLNKPAVCILAITADQKVITVEQFRPGPSATLNEMPGGFIDDGETPEAAAARELLEETGFAGNLQHITDCFDDAYTNMVRSCFVATDCKQVQGQQLDDGEFINVRLVDIADFLKIVRAGKMTDVEVALLGLDHLNLLTK
jgi:ADP-ribose pyrophosphatase